MCGYVCSRCGACGKEPFFAAGAKEEPLCPFCGGTINPRSLVCEDCGQSMGMYAIDNDQTKQA